MPTIDPRLSLALSIHSNKGIYAILLGSGISRSAGVPTGWDVIQVLIRRLAHLKNELCEPDPDAWFRHTFALEPEYSEVLGEIAKSPTERGQVLRAFFEPTDNERTEGLKQPTAAHRAIAELVSKGYIRIIVTTNFDRLMELALADAGVQPAVISTPDAALGALPLAHSPCTIIKINGDYLDTRLRNTRDELEHYDRPLELLLDRVLDEYGLIVCGWSGDWDTALRAAIERCASHRFTTFWATRAKVHEKGQNLITLRRATVIDIADADEFFRDMRDKVLALEQFALSDPVGPKVAVARMKKFLSDETRHINLFDLLNAETERAYAEITSARFATTGPPIHWPEVLARLRTYDGVSETLLHLMICGAYWAKSQHEALLLRCFKRISDSDGPQSGGLTVLNNLRAYPALLLLYGLGLSALARGNYRLLHSLLYLKIRQSKYQPEQAVAAVIHASAVLEPRHQLDCFSGTCTGLSDHLFELLRDPAREYLPGDTEYDQAFDWFEYLLALVHCDVEITRDGLAEKKGQDPDFFLPGPVGRFAWSSHHSGKMGIEQETELRTGEVRPEKVVALIQAGFFESAKQHDDKYRDVKAAFDRFVVRARFDMGRR
jgi:hypothetical protein